MSIKSKTPSCLRWISTLITLIILPVVLPVFTLEKTNALEQLESETTSWERHPTTINGQFDDSNCSDSNNINSCFNSYTFEGKAGEQITIEISSWTLEPLLSLIDPYDNTINVTKNNVYLLSSYGRNGTSKRGIFTFPTTGTYKIKITSRKKGRYTLSWRTTVKTDLDLIEAQQLEQKIRELQEENRYREVVDLSKAIQLAEEVLTIRRKILGDSNFEVIETLNILGSLFEDLERYEEAEKFYLQALEISKGTFEEDNFAIINSLNDLADFYKRLENYDKAENVYIQALELELESIQQIDFFNKLAKIYESLGNYNKAESLYLQALEISKRMFEEDNFTIINSLNKLADFYKRLGNYDKAESTYLQALELTKQLIIPKQLEWGSAGIATSLRKLADLYLIQRRYREVKTLFLEILEETKRNMGENHPDVVDSLETIAVWYERREKYSEAEIFYTQALEWKRRVLGQSHPKVADSLEELGNLYETRGLVISEKVFSELLSEIKKRLPVEEHFLFKEGVIEYLLSYFNGINLENLCIGIIDELKRWQGDDHPIVVEISKKYTLAAFEESREQYSKAEAIYKQAIEIRKQAFEENKEKLADSLYHLANFYHKQERFNEAEYLYLQALEIYKKILGENSKTVADTLYSLADLYRKLERYDEANVVYKQFLDKIFELQSHYLIDENQAFRYFENQAEHARIRNRYDEAEILYQKAFELRKKAFGENRPLEIAHGFDNLANVSWMQDQYDKAENFLLQALELRKQVFGKEHPEIAKNLEHLGRLYWSQEKYEQAEIFLLQALEMEKNTLGEVNSAVLESVKKLVILYYVQGNVVRVYDLIKQKLDIQEQLLNLNYFLSYSDNNRDTKIQQNLDQGIDLSDLSLFLSIKQNQDEVNIADLGLTFALKRKGRILDFLSNKLLSVRQNFTPSQQKLFNQLTAKRSQLAALIFKDLENLTLEQYQQQIASLKAEINQIETVLLQQGQSHIHSQPISISAVQQLIPNDAALVELVLIDIPLPLEEVSSFPLGPMGELVRMPTFDWNPQWDEIPGVDIESLQVDKPRYFAYILHSQGQPQWIDLGEAETINTEVKKFRRGLNIRHKPNLAKSTGRSLDELVMQPIREKLGNTNKILLSPDGELSLIPFAALIDENNQYLVENYQITYLNSGRDLLKLATSTPSSQSAVLIANPSFDEPGDVISQRTGSRSSNNQRSADLKKLTFSSLPGTLEEAAAIAPMLPGVQLLTQSQATEHAIKQIQGPSILHIATHGFFLEDVELVASPDYGILNWFNSSNAPVPTQENPLLRSGLALTGFNIRESGDEDGVLTALEVSGLDLYGTKLVVLSACETGLGEVQNEQGVYGLRRALVMAGAESQLISLWKVDDHGTKDLMVKYYQNLSKGLGRSEAFRQVQLEMLDSEKYQHPYFWSTFILSGDWTPIDEWQANN